MNGASVTLGVKRLGWRPALKAFFDPMPPKCGLAFIVVVHLEPTHENLLPEMATVLTRLVVS